MREKSSEIPILKICNNKKFTLRSGLLETETFHNSAIGCRTHTTFWMSSQFYFDSTPCITKCEKLTVSRPKLG